MAHRSFAAALAELDHEPITFDLAPDVTFTVPMPLPGIAIARFGKNAVTEFEDDNVAAAFAMGAYLDFFAAVMPEQTYKSFEQKCNELRVPIQMLVEIAQYVMEEATGRPTQQQSDSSGRSSNSSHLSPVAASNEV